MLGIWKYTLPNKEEFSILMPEGALIMAAQSQFNDPTIWVMLDMDKPPTVNRLFEMHGTGEIIRSHKNNITMTRKYIGTMQFDDGNFVLHLFELIDE